MKIYVLIENTSDNDLICEHGLSFLIEFNGKRILLDTGTTEAFYTNACKMGIDLTHLDAAVLSHGHFDHSGGYEKLFEVNLDVKVYAQKDSAQDYYSGSGYIHEIGVPKNVLSHEERFEYIDGYREIMKGVFLVPHNTEGLEYIGEKAKLYKMVGDELIPDDFCHEQSLVFETEEGLMIFNSCSHGGVKNIIREVKEMCGDKHIHAYIGGLHMKGMAAGEELCTFSDAEIDDLCAVIRNEGMKHIYTGHCTGIPGLVKMQERLGDVVQALTTGMIFRND